MCVCVCVCVCVFASDRVGGGDGHGSSIVRQYTPVSPLNHTGSFQVAIKVLVHVQCTCTAWST